MLTEEPCSQNACDPSKEGRTLHKEPLLGYLQRKQSLHNCKNTADTR